MFSFVLRLRHTQHTQNAPDKKSPHFALTAHIEPAFHAARIDDFSGAMRLTASHFDDKLSEMCFRFRRRVGSGRLHFTRRLLMIARAASCCRGMAATRCVELLAGELRAQRTTVHLKTSTDDYEARACGMGD